MVFAVWRYTVDVAGRAHAYGGKPRTPHSPLGSPVQSLEVFVYRVVSFMLFGIVVVACRDSRAATVAQNASQIGRATAANDPTQRFVSHTEHIQPGMVKPFAGMRLTNPHEGDATAVATGAKLFVSYNCIDCHGADGSG